VQQAEPVPGADEERLEERPQGGGDDLPRRGALQCPDDLLPPPAALPTRQQKQPGGQEDQQEEKDLAATRGSARPQHLREEADTEGEQLEEEEAQVEADKGRHVPAGVNAYQEPDEQRG